MHAMQATPKKQLTLFDSVSIILGIVIGAGIYETTPLIARSVPDASWLICLWFAGGFISLIGAACYAELTSAYPYEGGDYVFLTRAYGRRTGFLFTWAGFWLVQPANIGAIAYIFARYADQIWPLSLGHSGLMIYSIIAVVTLTLVNIFGGVWSGKWTQNVFTVAKVMGLLMIIIIGLFLIVPVADRAAASSTSVSMDLELAMILILFTYGGWSNISYVAAEVQNPRKNILRALLLGTILVTFIYILVNLAFVQTLGFTGVASSASVASDVISVYFDKAGKITISMLICITCLGNINGMIFTTSRIYYALGREHRVYRWLGTWSNRFDSPVCALSLQAAITLALVIGLGYQDDAFQRLVIFSAPLHWFFFSLVALSLFVLRRRDPHITRHYHVPFYPLTPILFNLATLFMLYAGLSYAWQHRHPEAYWIVIAILIGILVSLFDPPVQAQDG